jgi:hypothetical protein
LYTHPARCWSPVGLCPPRTPPRLTSFWTPISTPVSEQLQLHHDVLVDRSAYRMSTIFTEIRTGTRKSVLPPNQNESNSEQGYIQTRTDGTQITSDPKPGHLSTIPYHELHGPHTLRIRIEFSNMELRLCAPKRCLHFFPKYVRPKAVFISFRKGSAEFLSAIAGLKVVIPNGACWRLVMIT